MIPTSDHRPTRRQFLGAIAGAAAATLAPRHLHADEPRDKPPALIAITLDLEMARNFPRWEDVEWDYQKGNLDQPTKDYARAVCRRVKECRGKVHTFVVGQVFEQRDLGWLEEIVAEGHLVGNHTYDHVNLLAADLTSLQFRFQRAPWLVEGQSVADVIKHNIAMTSEAIRSRLKVEPAGFRTPGGFAEGLNGRPDLQELLLDQGFRWASCKYPRHDGMEDLHGTGRRPSKATVDAILAAQQQAQPFRYPSGLVEVPMSPISDIVAFRGGRWQLDDFVAVIRDVVSWVIDEGAVFDFLAHPSCLGVVDPDMKTVETICELVSKAGPKARFSDLNGIAQRASNGANA